MKVTKILAAAVTSVMVGVSCLSFAACGAQHEHSFGEWVTVTEATCTEKGLKERVCECGEKQTEELPASGHTFLDVWTSDGAYHWHASSCGHDAVDGKAEHTFENGVCKVCKRYSPLTEDTDFQSLVSEKVDEDGWKKAFENAFTDCTISYIQKERERTAYMKFDTVDGRLIAEYEHTELNDGKPYFYNKYWYERDGETVYMYSNIDIETGEPTDTYEKHDIYAEMGGQNEYMNDEVIDNWYMSYKMLCPDFSEFYEKFTYDVEKGAYVFSGSETNYIETNSIMEYWDRGYYNAIVKIINGKLAYVCILDNPSENIYFYDYDNTTITLPEYKDFT